MNFKKIVSLMLACALTISPLNSLAFAENDSTLTAALVKDLQDQLALLKANKALSKVKIESLKERIEKLVKDNKELKEKIEKLKDKNAKLSNISNTEKSRIFRDIFNVIGFWLFIGALICICVGIFYYNNFPLPVWWKKWTIGHY